MLGGLPELALCAHPLLVTPPAYSAPAETAARAGTAAAGPAGARAPLPLFEAIDRLPGAAEHRDGYKRDLYVHWYKGLVRVDGPR